MLNFFAARPRSRHQHRTLPRAELLEDRACPAAPVIEQLSLLPSLPRTNDMLIVNITASDADNDPLQFKYEWRVNGQLVRSTTSANLSDALDLSQPGLGDKNDAIEATVTPIDPTENGAPVSTALAVANSGPVVNDAEFSTIHDRTLYVNAEGSLLSFASDADQDNLVIAAIDGAAENVNVAHTTANGGSLTVYSHGYFAYTPPPNWTGDDTFEFTVSDGVASSTATATIHVTNIPLTVEDAEFSVIHDRTLYVNSEGSLLSFASDADQDNLFIAAIDGAAENVNVAHTTANGGTVIVYSHGYFAYIPPPNWTGDDTFDFTISDGAATRTATATIHVTNIPLTVEDAEFSVIHDRTLYVNSEGSLLSFASDADQDNLSISAIDGAAENVNVAHTTTNGGTVTVYSHGYFAYTPPPNWTGDDTFDFTISDGVASSTATATIHVTNNAPILANLGSLESVRGDVISLSLGASDADADSLTFSATGLPPGLGIDSNTGVISGTIASDADTSTPYSVTVGVFDGAVSATLTLSWSVNEAVLIAINPGDQTNFIGDVLAITLLAVGSPHPWAFSATGLPDGLSINSTGLITGTIDANANTTIPFSVTVTITDSAANIQTSASFDWYVLTGKPSFSATDPAAVDQVFDESAGLVVVPNWATFSPNSGTTHTTLQPSYIVTNVSNPSLFSELPSVDPTGSLKYMLAPGQYGTSTLDVILDDGCGNASDAQTFTIAVNQVQNFQVLEVNTLNDTPGVADPVGTVSLRGAITAGNVQGAPPLTIIRFSATLNGDITLTQALPPLNNNFTIIGNGPGMTRIVRSNAAGTPEFRIFDVPAGKSAHFSGLAIRNGKTSNLNNGAGIRNAGMLTLNNCLFRDNYAQTSLGDAISNTGQLAVWNTEFRENTAEFGGAIANGGGLLTGVAWLGGNTQVTTNRARQDGGGIYNNANSTLMVTGSEITSNRTTLAHGAGIMNHGVLQMFGGRLASNTAEIGNGGGLYSQTGSARLADVRIESNSAAFGSGGGVYLRSGTVTITGGTLTNNTSPNGVGRGVAWRGNRAGLSATGITGTLDEIAEDP